MLTRRLGYLFALLTAFALAGATWAADAPEKKERTKDPYRVVTGQITAARLKLIKSKPELAEAYKAIRDKQKQVMLEIKKEQDEFYAKLRAMSPELDDLEKKKEALAAERKKAQEAAMAERKRKAQEGRKGGGDKKKKAPRKKKEE
ncbi:hypothetical protein HQ560_19945 [bacterium]|nr:hypothetical protein [bacterium]